MRLSYCFTLNQLSVLLKGSGCSFLRGVGSRDVKLENHEVLSALNELSNMGILISDGEDFRLGDDARAVVEAIKNPDEYLFVRSSNSALVDLCCYYSDNLLICSYRDRYIPELVRINVTDEASLSEQLEEEGYFFVNGEGLFPDENEAEDFESNEIQLSSYEEPIAPDSPLLFNAERIDPTGRIKASFKIIEMKLYSYIYYFDSSGLIRDRLTLANARNYFGRLVKK